MYRYSEVIPAEAGIQTKYSFIIINNVIIDWIPVFTRMIVVLDHNSMSSK